MKRSASLRRYTPLRRSQWLRRRPPGTIPLQIREAVRLRARGRCERCKTRDDRVRCDAHHRRLRSQGGKDTVENLAYLCKPCHRWVHDNPDRAAQGRWIVRRGAA